MGIIVEADPEVGSALAAHLEAQGIEATTPQKRNFDFGGDALFQIAIALSGPVLGEMVKYLVTRYCLPGESAETALAKVQSLTIYIDGEKVPLERLAQPGEIERIVKAHEDI